MVSHNKSEMSDDSSGVWSGVGPDRAGYLPNWERVRSLVSRVYANASAQLIVHSLRGSRGFRGCQVGRRMEEIEN